ncbi:hypothetical protein TRFO_17292 [Tritrichomonas foetus]|uniref:BEACH domain-containing protein n=1 Tax=Tritrichomonas foetus TaxID=1144522 RepID=A0A1J4KTD4_9EUKA|nr:hypothetical protein TRFO_17292 [Tritrichomonas foetus]|eukprot:OHT12749.1 hypothetical protein TRFO_17292 [Tritrichomonas foetus]
MDKSWRRFLHIFSDDDSPDVKQFKMLVQKSKTDDEIINCFQFYDQQFGSIPIDEEIDSIGLERYINDFAKIFIPYFSKNLEISETQNKYFLFLERVIKINQFDKELIKMLTDFLIHLLSIDDSETINNSLSFLERALSNEMIAQILFNPLKIAEIYKLCFRKKKLPFSQLFLNRIKNFTFKNVENHDNLFKASLDIFNDEKIFEENEFDYEKALDFIGYVIKDVKSTEFLESFLPLIPKFMFSLNSLDFYKNYLLSSNVSAFQSLSNFCKEEISSDLLTSALSILFETKNSPLITNFSFDVFIIRAKSIPKHQQHELFEILVKFDIESRVNFIFLGIPPWKFGFDSFVLLSLIKTINVQNHIENIFNELIFQTNLDELYLNLNEDIGVQEILIFLCENVLSEQIGKAVKLFINLSYKKCAIVIKCLEILLPKSKPNWIVPSLIDELTKKEVCDEVYSLFTKLALLNDDFVQEFLKKGVSALLFAIETIPSVDFLSAIVCNGPYQIIDDFIFHNFEKTNLVKLSQNELKALMMGLPHDSQSFGLLRIPSLSKYVSNIELISPFDKYIYGKYGTLYKSTNVNVSYLCYASQYIDDDLVLDEIFKDSKSIRNMTKGPLPFRNIYLLHFDMPHAMASFNCIGTVIFWFYVRSLIGKTVILQTSHGDITYDCDGITVFDEINCECTLKKWHMITITNINKSFQNRSFEVYLDDFKLYENQMNAVANMTIGSENGNNAIWTIDSYIFSSPDVLTIEQIREKYNNNLTIRNEQQNLELTRASGFKLVEYKGINNYLKVMGGDEFIFLRLFHEDHRENFILYLKSAFDLLRKGAIEPKFFYSALKYIILTKSEFIDDEIESIFMKFFSRQCYINIFGDLSILSIEKFTFKMLPSIFNTDHKFKSLFNKLLDAFSVINFNDKAHSSIIASIGAYGSKNPESLIKILLTIAALHKISNEEIVDTNMISEKVDSQKILFGIILASSSLFDKYIPFKKVIDISIGLPDIFALNLLNSLVKICSDNYFETQIIEENKSFFIDLYCYEQMWTFFLCLVTKNEYSTINEFANSEIKRSDILPILFDIIASSTKIEMIKETNELTQGNNIHENTFNNIFSLKVAKIILPLCTIDHLLLCKKQIIRFCSFGFDDVFVSNDISFNLITGDQLTMKRKSLTPQEKYLPIKDLSQKLFEPTCNYLQKLEDSTENDNQEINSNSNYVCDQVINSIMNIDTIQILIEKTSEIIINLANSSPTPKTIFVQYTLFPSNMNDQNECNVDNKISRKMHTRIILSLLEMNPSFSKEAFSSFYLFLTNRVIEGFWDDSMSRLIKTAMPTFNPQIKKIKNFLIVSLSKINSVEEKLMIVTELFRNHAFISFLSDPIFFSVIQHFIITPEIVKSDHFGDLSQIIIESEINTTDFASAVRDNKLIVWFASQDDKYDEVIEPLLKNCSNSSQNIKNILAESTSIISQNHIVPYNKYKMYRSKINQNIRRAFRFQLFYRNNMNAYFLDDAISRLFKREKTLEFNRNHSDIKFNNHFMLVPSPHPLCVPQKMVPLAFEFNIPFLKKKREITLPRASQKSLINASDSIEELKQSYSKPVCLDHWSLPLFVNESITDVFLEICECTSSSLMRIDLLSTSEPLPCVLCLGQNKFFILLNSRLTSSESYKELVLPETSSMLCHFAAFEIPIFGYYGRSTLFANRPLLIIEYKDVSLAILRRYAYQSRTVDFFTVLGNHFTIIFRNETDRKQFTSKVMKISEQSQANIGIGFSSKLLQMSVDQVANLWISRRISNYDYLLYLNIASGRSFNDLSQYPVFPWIIGDYSASSNPKNQLALTDGTSKNEETKNCEENENENDEDEYMSYRDLSKPMGAQNEIRRDRFIAMYNETNYHYGTHYSHSAAVMHYMVRIEPYTFFGIHLHNGWDHRDRLFCNIAESWRSASDINQADVKELIPEFYTFPLMFENPNNLSLGERSDGLSLNTVTMPRWGKDPLIFVWKMRKALEKSDFINEWIDLIFGYKQRGEPAIEAVNVFHPMAYDDCFKNNDKTKNKQQHEIQLQELQEQNNNSLSYVELKAAIDMINNFGQCPKQLFTTPHPKRQTIIRETLFGNKESLFISELKQTSKDPERIRVVNDEIFVMAKNELFMGIQQPFVELVLNLDNIRSLCVSQDYQMFAYCEEFGVITIEIGNRIKLQEILLPINLRKVDSMAISSQHFLLCAVVCHEANGLSQILLFDITSGFLIRTKEIETNEKIVAVEFEENYNFITILFERSIFVLGIDFREITKPFYLKQMKIETQSQIQILDDSQDRNHNQYLEQNQDEAMKNNNFDKNKCENARFTSVSPCDSDTFSEFPFFIVGRSDGLCSVISINIVQKELLSEEVTKMKSSIASVKIFHECQAALIFDINKNLILLSQKRVRKQIVAREFFKQCPVCHSETSSSMSCCVVCGLFVCKNCRAKRLNVICTRCYGCGGNSDGSVMPLTP